MRVSKILAEHIKKSIENKASFKLRKLNKQVEEKRKDLYKDIEQFKESMEEALSAVWKRELTIFLSKNCDYKYRFEDEDPTHIFELKEDLYKRLGKRCVYYTESSIDSHIATNDIEKLEAEIRKLKQEIENKFTSVLLELELGSSKQDVEALLNKISFD